MSFVVYPQSHGAPMGYMPNFSLVINTQSILSWFHRAIEHAPSLFVETETSSCAIKTEPAYIFHHTTQPTTTQDTQRGLTLPYSAALVLRLLWPLGFPDEPPLVRHHPSLRILI